MVELESRGQLTRHEVAAFLREFADEFDERAGGGSHGDADVNATRGGRDERAERIETDREKRSDEHEGFTEGNPESRTAMADEEAAEVDEREPERLTLIVGGNSATVTLPDAVDFDVEVESSSPMLSSGVNQEIEFQLSWKVADEDEDLTRDRIDVE